MDENTINENFIVETDKQFLVNKHVLVSFYESKRDEIFKDIEKDLHNKVPIVEILSIDELTIPKTYTFFKKDYKQKYDQNVFEILKNNNKIKFTSKMFKYKIKNKIICENNKFNLFIKLFIKDIVRNFFYINNNSIHEKIKHKIIQFKRIKKDIESNITYVNYINDLLNTLLGIERTKFTKNLLTNNLNNNNVNYTNKTLKLSKDICKCTFKRVIGINENLKWAETTKSLYEKCAQVKDLNLLPTQKNIIYKLSSLSQSADAQNYALLLSQILYLNQDQYKQILKNCGINEEYLDKYFHYTDITYEPDNNSKFFYIDKYKFAITKIININLRLMKIPAVQIPCFTLFNIFPLMQNVSKYSYCYIYINELNESITINNETDFYKFLENRIRPYSDAYNNIALEKLEQDRQFEQQNIENAKQKGLLDFMIA